MIFSSIPFLYYFLPCFLIVYLLIPLRAKNYFLLLASLVFYAWGEPKYVLLMIAAILVGYVCGLGIERCRGEKSGKVWLVVGLVLSISILGFFKYTDFFIKSFNSMTGLSLRTLRIALPVGISFYTFQIISYLIDVYRGDAHAQKNPVYFGAYVSMFPQLIAGPIVRYSDISREISSRHISLSDFADGLRRFILGLGKKIIIANVLGELCDAFLASSDRSVAFCWLYAISFTLHIYFDFSAYSDMAIGLGRIMGFRFPENFNYPLISRSITEFWRRWHMTLGSWFRDYVYIPLGGNRCGKLKWLRNLAIVWFLTGMWHGASWNFIIWGVFFGVLLCLEKLWLYKHIEKLPVLGHIYVLIAVVISFVIFNAEDMVSALEVIGGMFGLGGSLSGAEFSYYLRSYGLTVLIAAIGATPLAKQAVSSLQKNSASNLVISVAEPLVLALLLVVSTAYLVDGSFNPFLYFRF